jgi:hypothetical protein
MTHRIIFGSDAADETSEVVAQESGASKEYVARIRDLHRLIGQKTAEIEILRSRTIER